MYRAQKKVKQWRKKRIPNCYLSDDTKVSAYLALDTVFKVLSLLTISIGVFSHFLAAFM